MNGKRQKGMGQLREEVQRKEGRTKGWRGGRKRRKRGRGGERKGGEISPHADARSYHIKDCTHSVCLSVRKWSK